MALTISARPTHLPHLSLAAFPWIDRPRHNRASLQDCRRTHPNVVDSLFVGEFRAQPGISEHSSRQILRPGLLSSLNGLFDENYYDFTTNAPMRD